MPDIIIQPGVHLPEKTFRFRTSRSSGPGGQNVNKLDTRVELVVELDGITGLTAAQADQIRTKLAGRLDNRNRLHFVSQRFRSQGQNKDDVVRMVIEEVAAALEPEKERKPTKPGRGAVQRRLEEKKKRSGTKKGRKNPAPGDDE